MWQVWRRAARFTARYNLPGYTERNRVPQNTEKSQGNVIIILKYQKMLKRKKKKIFLLPSVEKILGNGFAADKSNTGPGKKLGLRDNRVLQQTVREDAQAPLFVGMSTVT